MTVFISTKDRGLARARQNSDGGWIVEHLLASRRVHVLAKTSTRPDLLYAGVDDQGIWHSKDGGLEWKPCGLEGKVIKSISISPHNPDVIYAGSMPTHLYRSRDGAQTWEEMESFRQAPGRWWWFSPADSSLKACVQAIGISPADPDILVVGIEFGAVICSSDGGQTWQGHRRGALRDCHSLTFHHTDGRRVYEAGGSGAGAACSTDGGITWNQTKKGLDRHYGWACAADPQRSELWYASLSASFTRARPGVPAAHVDGFANAGIYRKIGEGNWELLGGGLPQPLNHMAYALLTDPASPGAVWAGLSHGEVWHSPDYGDTWQQLPFSLERIQRSLVMV
jgi:hypothetical protein